MPFRIRGRVDATPGEAPQAQYHTVSEGYFESLGVPLMAGRTFDAHDTANSEGVVVINQTLARQQFGRENPVGQTLISMSLGVGPLGSSLMKERAHRIIGVVGDVKNHSLQSPAEPALYHTVRQFPFMVMHVALRGQADASRLTALLREAVRATDPVIAISEVQTMDNVVDSAVSQLRLLTYLMAGFAAFALILAVVGIYGMLAYAVSQRQQEISIRLALGASRAGLLWLVLRQGLVLALTGAAIGAAGGIVLSRSMASLLYGVHASDAFTLAAVTALVVVRRARRLPDPCAARGHRRTARRPARRIAPAPSHPDPLPVTGRGVDSLAQIGGEGSSEAVHVGRVVHPTNVAAHAKRSGAPRRNLGHDASPPNARGRRGLRHRLPLHFRCDDEARRAMAAVPRAGVARDCRWRGVSGAVVDD